MKSTLAQVLTDDFTLGSGVLAVPLLSGGGHKWERELREEGSAFLACLGCCVARTRGSLSLHCRVRSWAGLGC